MIFLDTNIIYNFLFETELSDKAEEVIRGWYREGLAISMVVLNELLYVVGLRIARSEYGIEGRFSFKRFIARHGYPAKAIDRVLGFVKDFRVAVLPDFQDYRELVEVVKSYRLAPSDAQIALTCRYYGINTIATFDEDFKRIPWLRVVP